MNLTPTLQGGLKIDADSKEDWDILESICADAMELSGDMLYDRISANMGKNEDWEEFVAPDIRGQFSEQIKHVSEAIESATKNEAYVGSVFISKDDAPRWYGALNRARICLEDVYKVSEYSGLLEWDEIVNLEEDLRAAVIRGQFYTAVQCVLLEYGLD